MKILKYIQFINEAYEYPSHIRLTKKCISELEKASSSGGFRKVLVNPALEEIYLDDSGHICIKINGKDLTFPGLIFKDDKLDVIENELKASNINKSEKEWGITNSNLIEDEYWYKEYKYDENYDEDVNGWGKKRWFKVSDIISKMTWHLLHNIKEIISKQALSIINPWNDVDLVNNDNIKKIESLGIKLESTPQIRKLGTLRFNAVELGVNLTIHTNGSIRTIGSGGRPALITNNPDLMEPVTSEEILDKKLNYVYLYGLKKVLERAGLSTGEINSVINGNSTDSFNIIKGFIEGGNVSGFYTIYDLYKDKLTPDEIQNIIKSIMTSSKKFAIIKMVKEKIPGLYDNMKDSIGDTMDDASLLGELGF